MTRQNNSWLGGRALVVAAPLALAATATQVAFGCTSCEGPIAPYSFAPIGSTLVVVDAELPAFSRMGCCST